MPRYEIIVKGRVQGVGFRAFTESIADKLGIKGYVKNLPDGTVEVVAEGDDRALNELCSSLKAGPSMAYVDDLDIIEKEYTGEFRGFSVKF
ncbi:acylphosphatase [Flexistipes sp.]|uniref:acylphosphatase n=1 Tax=Flexistipes sp. TaxID=3088135 RepID=UPI002E1DF888|nr:acylphosphatase [Flexistipes sp.]